MGMRGLIFLLILSIFLSSCLPIKSKTSTTNKTIEYYLKRSKALAKKGYYKDALDYTLKAYKISVKYNGENNRNTSLILNEIGKLYIFLREDKALDYFAKAFKISKKINDYYLMYVTLYNTGVYYLKVKKDIDTAFLFFVKALMIADNYKLNDEESLYIKTEIYRYISLILLKKNRYEEAYQFLELAENLGKNLKRKNSIHLCKMYYFYSLVYKRLEQYENQSYYLKKALDLAKKNKCYRYLVDIYTYLMEAYIKEDNLKEIEKFLLELEKEYKNSDELIIPIFIYENLADLYISSMDMKKAVIYLKKEIKLKGKMFGKDSKEVLNSKIKLASIYLKLNKTKKSVKILKEMIEPLKKRYGENSEVVAKAYTFLGFMIVTSDYNLNKALYYLKKAYQIYLNLYGENNLKTLNALNSLASLYMALHKYDKALEIYLKLYEYYEGYKYKDKDSDVEKVISIYRNLSGLLMLKGDYKKSILIANKGLKILNKHYLTRKRKENIEDIIIFNGIIFKIFYYNLVNYIKKK
jgi:tetratricopeptide (TPR) repeat protein